MKFMRIATSLSLIVVMSTCVAYADGTAENVTPQTVTRIAKVAGSIIQATVRSVDRATTGGPAGLGDIAAVCITSGSDDVGQCGVSATLARAGCTAAGRLLSACHGGDRVAHVALCNAEDVGLSGCLSKYAVAVVRHPDVAEKAYQFSVRRDDKNLPDITVLVTAKQTEQDAAQMALDSMASATTASRN
jgi:hypothetical protein